MPQVENSRSKIFAQPLAIGLGAALLLGYAIVTGYAIYGKAHRATIEHADASNGVGDRTFFTKSFDPALPLVNFDGHSLYYLGTKALADSAMARVGMDDSNTYAVYRVAGAKGGETSSVYLKIGPNDYVSATEKK